MTIPTALFENSRVQNGNSFSLGTIVISTDSRAASSLPSLHNQPLRSASLHAPLLSHRLLIFSRRRNYPQYRHKSQQLALLQVSKRERVARSVLPWHRDLLVVAWGFRHLGDIPWLCQPDYQEQCVVVRSPCFKCSIGVFVGREEDCNWRCSLERGRFNRIDAFVFVCGNAIRDFGVLIGFRRINWNLIVLLMYST